MIKMVIGFETRMKENKVIRKMIKERKKERIRKE